MVHPSKYPIIEMKMRKMLRTFYGAWTQHTHSHTRILYFCVNAWWISFHGYSMNAHFYLFIARMCSWKWEAYKESKYMCVHLNVKQLYRRSRLCCRCLSTLSWNTMCCHTYIELRREYETKMKVLDVMEINSTVAITIFLVFASTQQSKSFFSSSFYPHLPHNTVWQSSVCVHQTL